ncbi:hypothetical protein TorRG33x02_323190 [Trema orientale]|uniref:Uncharacterized protein n=1 Tax=Trema orientale TaxID=63057 RepID=A0A2P5BFC8_TREOI|nr:hypothetical protein TorRG33x02_323190 [Trema orientale]
MAESFEKKWIKRVEKKDWEKETLL